MKTVWYSREGKLTIWEKIYTRACLYVKFYEISTKIITVHVELNETNEFALLSGALI